MRSLIVSYTAWHNYRSCRDESLLIHAVLGEFDGPLCRRDGFSVVRNAK